jgi:hypothetical protein
MGPRPLARQVLEIVVRQLLLDEQETARAPETGSSQATRFAVVSTRGYAKPCPD